MVEKVRINFKTLKKGGFCDRISTVKREITINKELLFKIELAWTFINCKPKIKNGNLRIVEKTNIAYVFFAYLFRNSTKK